MKKKVQLKATKFATSNVPGGIIHTDPAENADKRARYPLVTEEQADILIAAGVAEKMKGEVADEEGGERLLSQQVEKELAKVADADADAERPTGLSTRATTAHASGPAANDMPDPDMPPAGDDDDADKDDPYADLSETDAATAKALEDAHTRGTLNKLATAAEIAEPKKLGNKGQVAAAIVEKTRGFDGGTDAFVAANLPKNS